MERERMTRRRFLGKAMAVGAGLAVLGLGVQCRATPTPKVVEKIVKETVVAKETILVEVTKAVEKEVKGAPTAASEAPERILFIGSSTSSYNEGVETHLRSLAASAAPPLTIETSTAYIPGARLEDHWKSSSTLKAIRENGCDTVVLQGDDWETLTDEQGFYEYARKLDSEVKKTGAHTVFFMVWEILGSPEWGISRVPIEVQERAYNSIGAELGARVAPVGLAWEHSIQENRDLSLYESDGDHPTTWGTYLAACVFYATLFGRSPVGLPYKPIIWVTDEEAAFLQRVAWETVQEYKQPAAD